MARRQRQMCIRDSKNILSLKKLVKRLKDKMEIIVTFLALLEMIKEGEIICHQKQNFDDIEIKLNVVKA